MKRTGKRSLACPWSLGLAGLLVAWLAEGLAAQQPTPAGQGAEQEAAAGAVPAEPPGDSADATAGDWMGTIDQFVGDVVGALELVFFYDFGSEHWLGAKVPFVVAWLFVGAVFFTLRMRFINFRAFKHSTQVTQGKYDNPKEPGEVTHFQALASALSATVGLGNIAGVAIAVGRGGPGAIFWMVLCGLLGMTSKFTECTLGQKYRKVDLDGRVSGGAMHYLQDGLAELGLRPLGKVLAVVFAVLCIGGAFGGGNAFQVNQSLGAIRERIEFLDKYPWIYGLVIVTLVGLVIIGGIKRIAATASKIVPVMCAVYVITSLFILVVKYQQLAAALHKIVVEAFSPTAVAGGVLGVMVVGITRAAFSNEAGIGSAPIAHAAARTKEPVREGIVALLEPFIDTVVVCTMTGLVIVVTGVYEDEAYQHFVTGNDGAALTAVAFEGVVSWFPWILAAALFLFAYSTLISWSYYGERCWTYLFGSRASMAFKVLYLLFAFLASIVTATNILDFANMMILAMAFPNILGLVLLSGKVKRDLDEYMHKLRRGEFPAYN